MSVLFQTYISPEDAPDWPKNNDNDTFNDDVERVRRYKFLIHISIEIV